MNILRHQKVMLLQLNIKINFTFFLKGCESKLKFCKSKEDKIILMQYNLKNLFEKNYKFSKKKKI